MRARYDLCVYANRRIAIIVAAVFVIAAAALALWYFAERQRMDATGILAGPSASYANSQFGYSLSYPSKYQVRELAPEFVMIGPTQNGSIEGMANVAVLHAQKSEPLPSSSAFVNLVAQLACNQNSGTSGSASVNCTSVAQSTPFTAESGLAGQELYFNSNAGKRGPFYAFDISNKVPNEYAVLLVYPPTSLAQNDQDQALLQDIAQSLQVH